MAGASMNDIKSRIKSVRSTMQITKAMELVATSKLRRAKERAEGTRPYYEALSNVISKLFSLGGASDSPYAAKRDCKNALFVVIAGDRGLAGGYNANVFRLTSQLSEKFESVKILPIGKKACDYYRHRSADIFAACEYVSETGVGECYRLAESVSHAYEQGEIDKVILVYTHFASMISQLPVYEEILPLEREEEKSADILFDTDPVEMLSKIIPEFIGGIFYSAVCDSVASECGARRTAMNSANKNASEMIDALMLKFNRARQAVITQEITEIVSGAEAL